MEWSIVCHEIRTSECPIKCSGNTYKMKQKNFMFNPWNLELQDITETKSIHKFKKLFEKLQDIVKHW